MNADLESIINDVGAARARRSPAADAPSASQQLKKWWMAERAAPVLLAYQGELLQTVVAEVRSLMLYIEETSVLLLEGADGAAAAGGDVKVQLLLVETELERVKFIARAYKRTRLAKIDAAPYHYLQHQTEDGTMSKDEWIYCHRHTELLANHYDHSFLGALPESLQDLTDTTGNVSMIEEPDLDKPVAVRVLHEMPTPIPIGSEQVEMEKGGLYLLRYSAVAELGDSVELI